MLRLILPLVLLILPSLANASGGVVYLAIFSCPTCYQVDEGSIAFQKRWGKDFHFVAVPTSPNDTQAKLWYALKGEVDNPWELKTELFKSLHVMRMPDVEMRGVIEYLRVRGVLPERLSSDDIAKKADSTETMDRMEKAIRLAVKGAVSGTPALIRLEKGEVVDTFEFRSGMTPTSFVQEALSKFRD